MGCDGLSAAERADVEASVLGMRCSIHRRESQAAAWTVVASDVPCLLTLSGAPRETSSAAAHEDRLNSQVLLPSGSDVEQNDRIDCGASRFVVRLIDPDSRVFLRCLGRLER